LWDSVASRECRTMPVHTPEYAVEVAGKKKKPSEPNARVELRVDPAWLERIQKQAERRAISVSAYIRQAASMQLQRDEAAEKEDGEARHGQA